MSRSSPTASGWSVPSNAASVAFCLFLATGCAATSKQRQGEVPIRGELEQDEHACLTESLRATKDVERRQTDSLIDSGGRIGVGSVETDRLIKDLRGFQQKGFEQCMDRKKRTLRKKTE
jgi:hypothetical protein